MTTKRRKKTAVQNLNIPATSTSQLRAQLSTCTGKICAYKEVGKNEDAKDWAYRLIDVLKLNDLLPQALP